MEFVRDISHGFTSVKSIFKTREDWTDFFLVLDFSVVGNHEPTVDRTQEFNLNNKLIEKTKNSNHA